MPRLFQILYSMVDLSERIGAVLIIVEFVSYAKITSCVRSRNSNFDRIVLILFLRFLLRKAFALFLYYLSLAPLVE